MISLNVNALIFLFFTCPTLEYFKKAFKMAPNRQKQPVDILSTIISPLLTKASLQAIPRLSNFYGLLIKLCIE
jgi:hypothetical protein